MPSSDSQAFLRTLIRSDFPASSSLWTMAHKDLPHHLGEIKRCWLKNAKEKATVTITYWFSGANYPVLYSRWECVEFRDLN